MVSLRFRPGDFPFVSVWVLLFSIQPEIVACNLTRLDASAIGSTSIFNILRLISDNNTRFLVYIMDRHLDPVGPFCSTVYQLAVDLNPA